MNGHVGRINRGYAGIPGVFGYGIRNTDASGIQEFTDSLGLVICTCFMKHDSKLVSYELSPNKCTVDYVLVGIKTKGWFRMQRFFQARCVLQNINKGNGVQRYKEEEVKD